MSTLPDPAFTLALLQEQLGLTPLPTWFIVHLNILVGLYGFVLFFLLAGITYRLVLIRRQWRQTRTAGLRRIIPIVSQLGAAVYCWGWIPLLLIVYREEPGPRLNGLTGQLMVYVPLAFTGWCLTFHAAHALPARRAIVDLQYGRPPARQSGIRKIMESSVTRTFLGALLPLSAIFSQGPTAVFAGMSQKKFKTVFDQLQVVLETAVAEEGWQGSNAVAGGELLVQFQDASEDVTSKTRLMLAIFLAWDLVTAMLFIPYAIALSNVLRRHISHLKHSLVTAAALDQIQTHVAFPSQAIHLDRSASLRSNISTQQPIGVNMRLDKKPSPVLGDIEDKLFTVTAVHRLFMLQAIAAISTEFALAVLGILGLASDVLFVGHAIVGVLLPAYGFLLPTIPAVFVFLVSRPVQPLPPSRNNLVEAPDEDKEDDDWAPTKNANNPILIRSWTPTTEIPRDEKVEPMELEEEIQEEGSSGRTGSSLGVIGEWDGIVVRDSWKPSTWMRSESV